MQDAIKDQGVIRERRCGTNWPTVADRSTIPVTKGDVVNLSTRPRRRRVSNERTSPETICARNRPGRGNHRCQRDRLGWQVHFRCAVLSARGSKFGSQKQR